jgi:predicted nucleic acid-binding protein
LDERLGTKVANELGLQTIGLLGVIVKAKNESYIERVKPLMDQLRAKGFWVSDKLVEIILERVGE